MTRRPIEAALAEATFAVLRAQTAVYARLPLPVISTGRPFAFYRTVFFDGASEEAVLASLRGKTVVDVGCGLTPHMADSMFQACRRAGVDFYGVDPKLGGGFKLGPFDWLKAGLTGSRAIPDRNAPGLDKALRGSADALPFADASVDIVLCSWLLFAWIREEPLLGAILREFHRVLKPGGTARIFPTWAFAPDAFAAYGFTAGQRFFGGRNLLVMPPAYMTTLTARAA